MHCPECGFVNTEGANYCQKCGAFLGDKSSSDDTTIAYTVGDTGELQPVDLDRVSGEGSTLVIRAGGGRAGETFSVAGDQMRIGRSPDAEVFLDDVTVSRNHALLRSEEHTSELQSRQYLVCRLLLEKKNEK